MIAVAAESPHVLHAGRIGALADDGPLLAALGQAGIDPAGWTRTYARLHPERPGFATIVLERGTLLVRVEAHGAAQPEVSEHELAVPHPDAGWLAVARLPWDPELPGLPEALAGPGARIVRYRPYRRCTVRAGSGAGLRFVKVFADGRAPRLLADGRELWRAGEDGELGFAVPRPERAAGHALWLEPVAGEPLKERVLGPGGQAMARRLGAAAAEIGASSARPGRVFDGSAQLAATARRCTGLTRLLPGLAPMAAQLLARVRALHAALPLRELRPLHGDMTAGQWLMDSGGRLGLLDLDHVALGHPELDVATFLADAAFRDPACVPADSIGRAFVAGWRQAGRPLDERLLAAYLAHRAVRKAVLAAHAVRPDAERRAARRLERGLAWLAEVGA